MTPVEKPTPTPGETMCPICGFDMTPDPDLTVDRWISWGYHLEHHIGAS